MVRTRKSEAERDLDEIELATEKVSLASFFFFFPSPLPSSCYPLSPPYLSFFIPRTQANMHSSIPCCVPRDVFVHARVGGNTWFGQSAIFMDAISSFIYIYTFSLESAL